MRPSISGKLGCLRRKGGNLLASIVHKKAPLGTAAAVACRPVLHPYTGSEMPGTARGWCSHPRHRTPVACRPLFGITPSSDKVRRGGHGWLKPGSCTPPATACAQGDGGGGGGEEVKGCADGIAALSVIEPFPGSVLP